MIPHRMKFWAVMHKPTGNYLPEPPTGASGKPSYTSTTPTSPKDLPPRLHVKKSSAEKALTWWLKGAMSMGPTGHVEVVVAADRVAEDMEVVPMVLKRTWNE